MIKVFEEHPAFDQYTRFDTDTGRLDKITRAEFERYLESGAYKRPVMPCCRDDEVRIYRGDATETHVRFPRRVYFQITRRCNLRCRYCFINAGNDGPHVPAGYIWRIASYFSRMGLMEVRLTGGEPTLHPEFNEIVQAFVQNGIYVSIATNGVWGDKAFETLCGMKGGWIICSVDGGKTAHDELRCGSFDTVMKNLKRFRQRSPETRLRLTSVLTRININQMEELCRIGGELNAESLTVIPLRPKVRCAEINDAMPDAEEFFAVIRDLVRAGKRYDIKVTTTIETNFKNDLYPDPVVRKYVGCAAGREATNLDYDSKRDEFFMYGCAYCPASDLSYPRAVRAPFIAGAFKPQAVEDFGDIWSSEDKWRLYRDHEMRSENCAGCEYLANRRCTGSCPIQNIDLSEIDFDDDALKQIAGQIKSNAEWYCYRALIDKR